MSNLTCAHCGKQYAGRARLDICSQTFCSRACYAAAKVKRVTVFCETCSKTFDKKRDKFLQTQHHYCSKACADAVGKVQVQCYYCSKIITRQKCTIKGRAFCSRTCCDAWGASAANSGENSPYWKGGGISYRGENWNQQRRAALQRDNHTCQSCNAAGVNLDVHHIWPFHLHDNYKKANRLENLITLCDSCHTSADNKFWQDHPDLVTSRRLPDVSLQRNCSKCGVEFAARSSQSKFCDACHTFTCQVCSKQFVTADPNSRTPKYCSSACYGLSKRKHSLQT